MFIYCGKLELCFNSAVNKNPIGYNKQFKTNIWSFLQSLKSQRNFETSDTISSQKSKKSYKEIIFCRSKKVHFI